MIDIMWYRTFRGAVCALFVLLLTFGVKNLYGQNDTTINRYFLIELAKDRMQPYVEMPPVYGESPKSRNIDNSRIVALKTNLLFDALSMVNIEVELPVAQRWSLAAELIFPWWTMDNHRESSKRNRLQILNGTLEAKYWWGERAQRPTLTGWFSGVYVSLGRYDIEYRARGYQGNAIFTAGASGGYAHPINRRGDLRMEYTLGVGYMTTYYHHYHAEFCDNDHWHAVEMRRGRYNLVGVTRAKVSLVWAIGLF